MHAGFARATAISFAGPVQTLRFVKYHGIGNDFIVVDADDPSVWEPDWAQRLCDRHRGIGADGVLLVGPGQGAARASMRVLNADGSEPEMCGNGLRCVALHLALADETTRTEYVVDTGAGPLGCSVVRDGTLASVRIAMGPAKMLGDLALELEGAALSFTRVSTGNPHAVIFDVEFDEARVDRIAPLVSAAIRGGANVEFVEQRGPSDLRVVVWERGVGRTLACGTGAVAAAAAAAVGGRVPYGDPVTVELPGGPLYIQIANSLDAQLEGPAQLVFRGDVTL